MISTTVAVDLGGTHMRAAIVDDAGTVLTRLRRPTPGDDPTPEALIRLVADLVGQGGDGLVPVGAVVGVPGLIDHERERLVHAPNLPAGWVPHLNGGWLEERIGLPVSLANDADLAAVGESSFGAGRNHRDVVYVTISTGVGAGLVVADRLVRGAYSGGELGHTIIDHEAAIAGRPATVEELGAGPALVRRARRAGVEATGPELAELVRSGHDVAAAIWREAIGAVGVGIANLAWIVAPDIVVIGGGVGLNGDLVLPIIGEQLRRFGPVSVPEIEVANAELGDDVALAGASRWWQAVGREIGSGETDRADHHRPGDQP